MADLAISADPAVPAHLNCDTVMWSRDSTRRSLPRGTPCFARPEDASDACAVDLYERPPCPWWQRNAPLTSFALTAQGSVARSSIAIDERELYVPMSPHAPLFPHEPCASDVVQTDSRSCGLAAAAIAVAECSSRDLQAGLRDNGDDTVSVRLYDDAGGVMQPRWYRMQKSVAPGATSSGALWWRMLEKGIATQGWDVSIDGVGTTRSHVRLCPGAWPDRMLGRLTGRRTAARYLDFNSAPSVFSALVAALSRPGGVTGLLPQHAAALQSWLRSHASAANTLLGYDDVSAPLSSEFLEAFLRHHGLDASTCDAVCGLVCRAMQACSPAASRDPLTDIEASVLCTIQQGLADGACFCVSTRGDFAAIREPHLTQLHDRVQGARDIDYAMDARAGQVIGGLWAGHAYAVLGVRFAESVWQVRLCEPRGRGGRRYATRFGARIPLATSSRDFWIDARDLFRYCVALYSTVA